MLKKSYKQIFIIKIQIIDTLIILNETVDVFIKNVG